MSGTSKIPEEILDDLSSRFIINIPKNERTGLNRVSFQIELAHWFYLDYYCVQNPSLRPYKLKEFFIYIFQHIPFLKKYEANIDSIYNQWREYKQLVPTFGAVLIDDTLSHILLVQGFMGSWGFPKGKVNQEEDPVDCACREVFEETGLDITKLIQPDEYVESTIHDQLNRLYFIVGINKNITFEPQTRGEIKAVKWFPIEELPISKRDIVANAKTHGTRYFFMVIPFMKRIINWIEDMKRRKCNKRIERSKRKSESEYPNNKTKKPPTPNDKRKSQFVNKIIQMDQSFSGSYNSEMDTTEEFNQSFSNLSASDAKSGSLSKKKLRNFQRNLNRKNNFDLKKQLEVGSEHWKNFHFDRERILRHLQ
ncbi:m7GpppN-mRNA hydrolase [Planococcus citri]|uniref:m7GpppN-mRNA hydrolase n=1 Tax=Planococcus citri TaxID=170843 RepID=UPI0031FA26D0